MSGAGRHARGPGHAQQMGTGPVMTEHQAERVAAGMETATGVARTGNVDTAALVERMARRLAVEEQAAEVARMRARASAATSSGGRWVRQDGSEVRPMVAFPDAVDLDGSEMLDEEGKSLVKPGYAERWVRFDQHAAPAHLFEVVGVAQHDAVVRPDFHEEPRLLSAEVSGEPGILAVL